ncbi:ABC transporter substrate-binding protein [Cellulomonas sp. C5510]|uniref:ABC transporter substrate-binding protein n=1 Tax=Cellulomonas sp. C5510 TaxID=2871170 RepID=UPI001C984245|nr:ABC transporter substrate-binding protein [Cellulomonas sp. C5510]QZN87011.1 ABC transporter substrate-binding protein [Cellulomonas sp. C5510]
MARKSLAAISLAVAAGVALTACSSGGASQGGGSSSAPATSAINTVLWYAPSNFDPATASSSPDLTAARLGFDTLLRKGDDGAYLGGLATDWEAASASSYTFTVRDDATCADGTPITAQVVADSLENLAASEGTNTRSLAFGDGDPTFTVDDAAGTVAIELSQPYSQLLGGMTLEGTGIICPAGLADPEGLAAGQVEGAFSGPYTLTGYSAGVSATYTLRDDYDAWPDWEGVEGTPATTINITVESDSNTSANLLESGGLDVARFYDSNATRFTENDAFGYVTDNSTANTLLFNEDPTSVFADDQELRAAVAQAVSAEAFNAAALDGLGNLMTSVTDSGFANVLDDESLLQPYDPEAAAEVLTGTTIRLLTMTNWEPAVDYVTEALSAAGATVQVESLDASEWAAKLRTEPTTWDLTIRGETNSSGLVHQALVTKIGPSFTEGGTNYTSSDNPEGEAYLAAALSSADPDEQSENFLAAQETLLERVDMAPLATSTHYIVTREGFAAHTFSGYWDVSALRITS